MNGVNKYVLLPFAALSFLFLLVAATQPTTPLRNAFLQSDLNGNGKSITNVATIKAANFLGGGSGLTNLNINGLSSTNNVLVAPRVELTNSTAPMIIHNSPNGVDLALLRFKIQSGAADVGGFNWLLTSGYLQLSVDQISGPSFGGIMAFNDGEVDFDELVTAPGFSGSFSGNGSGLSSLNAANITSGIVPANSISLYVQGTENLMGGNYTMTITSTDLASGFGLTTPTTGIYIAMGSVVVKYVGATYAGAQTMTFNWRRTNNTPGNITTGLPVELPVLTTFTGGNTVAMPPIAFNATAGDVITIFGVLSAAPSAGSVQITAASMTLLRVQ
jgi:hypothetical protein